MKYALSEARIKAGLTQAQLAERADMLQSKISRFETGERDLRTAQACTVLRIARALNTTVEDLIGDQS